MARQPIKLLRCLHISSAVATANQGNWVHQPPGCLLLLIALAESYARISPIPPHPTPPFWWSLSVCPLEALGLLPPQTAVHCYGNLERRPSHVFVDCLGARGARNIALSRCQNLRPFLVKATASMESLDPRLSVSLPLRKGEQTNRISPEKHL